MNNNNKGHQKTLDSEMFPQMIPHPENRWGNMESKKNDASSSYLERIMDVILSESESESIKDFDSNPDGSKYEQPSLDEIWNWFGETDGETLADDA